MSTTHYQLLERHAQIDDGLRRELGRKIPDPLLVQRLKRMKLAIKDRIAAMISKEGR